jgi:plasmid replication initiation protein
MAMEVFRQLVGCSDQPAYAEFRRLSEKIIKPAVREVNETSDIELTPEYKRESRKVKSVRMKIADKRDLPPLRSKRGKAKPAEDAARVSAVVDEMAERERLAREKAAAEKALQEMKAMLAKPSAAAS